MSEAKAKTAAPAKKAAAPKKAETATKAAAPKKSGARVAVIQIHSGAGRSDAQIATLKGLGLGKLHRRVELEDTPSVRGMINAVKHLVCVEGEGK